MERRAIRKLGPMKVEVTKPVYVFMPPGSVGNCTESLPQSVETPLWPMRHPFNKPENLIQQIRAPSA
jgi:hypothetical protein